VPKNIFYMDSMPLDMPGSGAAQLLLGPMASGKTLALCQVLRRYTYMNKNRVIVSSVKASLDTREQDNSIRSRNGMLLVADLIASSGEQIWEHVQAKMRGTSGVPALLVVGIDEAQFISNLPHLVLRVLQHGYANTTILLYMAALNGTFKREAWPEISAVLPLCSSVRMFSAVCACCGHHDAPFSRRDVDNTTDTVLIGGDAQYSAVCARCFAHKGRCQ